MLYSGAAWLEPMGFTRVLRGLIGLTVAMGLKEPLCSGDPVSLWGLLGFMGGLGVGGVSCAGGSYHHSRTCKAPENPKSAPETTASDKLFSFHVRMASPERSLG